MVTSFFAMLFTQMLSFHKLFLFYHFIYSGTGKTITGVHIACWFAERNKRLKSYKVWEKDAGETEIEGAYKAPPQVIYCGPSNKSVDVVTGKLCLLQEGNDFLIPIHV